jgi:hypothetical protein
MIQRIWNLAIGHLEIKTGFRFRIALLGGSVLIWHMIDRFSTACCLYGAR